MYFSKRNKLPCFVTEGIGICPKCKRTTTNTSITYISKRKREVPISTHLCTKCNNEMDMMNFMEQDHLKDLLVIL